MVSNCFNRCRLFFLICSNGVHGEFGLAFLFGHFFCYLFSIFFFQGVLDESNVLLSCQAGCLVLF